MPKRASFSKKNVDIYVFASHHKDLENSVRLYFSQNAPSFLVRFIGYSELDINSELNERIDELELASSLTVLSAVEAAFRIDYLQRCYRKEKDPVSRALRSLYRKKQAKVSMEDDILEIWNTHTNGAATLIGKLRAAFKFRHWLAHGRYWKPKLGQQYDYLTIYSLAQSTLESFPLLGA